MIPLLFVTLFTLALCHWAYESAIAPSLRLGARYKLFSVRNELRNLAAMRGVQLNHGAINLLETIINSAIERMHDYDFAFIVAVNRRAKSDESFRLRMEHRVAVIKEYQDPDFVRLLERYETIFKEVTLINVGGWFLYVVPIGLAAICWGALRKIFLYVSVVPENDVICLADNYGDYFTEAA